MNKNTQNQVDNKWRYDSNLFLISNVFKYPSLSGVTFFRINVNDHPMQNQRFFSNPRK